jgi:CheY-like chemotaxis protein
MMKILVVEDNKGDQVILREAFQEAQVDCQLDMVKDGVEAMEYLRREGGFSDALKPDLIILDLNLPKKNGREVLTELKQDPKLQHIPVLVFSNSVSPKDICECYALNANVYAGKPAGYQGFVDFARSVKDFWSGIVLYCAHP